MPRGWTWGSAKQKGIPEICQIAVKRRIELHAASKYAGRYLRLSIRFRGRFCYVDAFKEPHKKFDARPSWYEGTKEQWFEEYRNNPVHLIRLTYLGSPDLWELGFFTYSNDKYSACVFPDGSFTGTPEAGFDIGATYL